MRTSLIDVINMQTSLILNYLV